MSRLDGRVAIVTGGARGMGEAHARALASQGARVVIGDLLRDEGGALAAELGDDARFVALDVTDEASWRAAVAFAEDAFGPISVLINNAGVLAVEPIAELAIEEWRRVLDTNLSLHGLQVGAARADQGGGDRVRARPHPGQLAASRNDQDADDRGRQR
jgi:3alpha(or 20beta)-hydroxysteroid dehydrogenase